MIKSVRLDDLKPHPKNAKLHPKKQVEKIAKSISEYGFNNPVLISSDNTILAGHGRCLAQKLLNKDTVPCLVLDHLSPEQARAFILADNKVSESGYDVDALCDELQELASEGFDSIKLGFDDDEMEKLMNVSNVNDEELLDLDETIGEIRVGTNEWWDIDKHKMFVGGRRLDIKKLYTFIKDSKEPVTLFLPERQAQTLCSLYEKRGIKASRNEDL